MNNREEDICKLMDTFIECMGLIFTPKCNDIVKNKICHGTLYDKQKPIVAVDDGDIYKNLIMVPLETFLDLTNRCGMDEHEVLIGLIDSSIKENPEWIDDDYRELKIKEKQKEDNEW